MFESAISTMGPELLLAGAALLGVLIGAALGDRFNSLSFRFGALVLIGAGVLSITYWQGGTAFGGLATTSPFASFAKTVSYFSAAIALLMADGFLKRSNTHRYEYPLLVMLASLGIGVTLSANDFMT
ncbi:MAG: NADH-quinone oxidoreductase subunit N, partial [Pseudomonadota bacterium]